MKISNEKIKEIAENLDCGMICFINKKTNEVKSIIDPDDIYAEEEHWKEDLEEIESNWDDYFKIEKMSSREAFQIMEDFTNQVLDERIKNRLIDALNRNKPFKNFKYEVDYHEPTRQHWFKYKAFRYQEWVKDHLNYLELNSGEDLSNHAQQLNTMTYYNDDGSEYNPNLYPLPNLCLSCIKREDPSEEIVCNLTRMDQLGEEEFKCFAYKKINSSHK